MYQGSCLCGSIRFEVNNKLEPVVNCHCKYCRKAHAAAFATFLSIPDANFKITQGEDTLTKHGYRFANSDAYRCFCSICGTRLFNHLPSINRASVSVAALELSAEEDIRPVAHINCESKCSWLELSDDLPQFEGVPLPGELGRLLEQ